MNVFVFILSAAKTSPRQILWRRSPAHFSAACWFELQADLMQLSFAIQHLQNPHDFIQSHCVADHSESVHKAHANFHCQKSISQKSSRLHRQTEQCRTIKNMQQPDSTTNRHATQRCTYPTIQENAFNCQVQPEKRMEPNLISMRPFQGNLISNKQACRMES